MYQTINESDFLTAFAAFGRLEGSSEDGSYNFTRAGARALFEYLEEYEDSIGEPLELDVIALCCDFAEYDSAWAAMLEYQPDDMITGDIVDENDEGRDLVEIDELQEAAALEWLREQTTVIEFDTGVIIGAF